MSYKSPLEENNGGLTDPNNPSGNYGNPNTNQSPLDENWAKSALNVAAPKGASWWDPNKALQYANQYAQKGQGNQGDWINWAIRDTEKNAAPSSPPPPSTGAYTGPRWTAQDVGRGDVRDQMMGVLNRYGATADDVQRAITENPDVFRGARLIGTNRDKLDFGNGVIVDVRGGAARGMNQLQWMDPNHPVYTGNYSAHGGAPGQNQSQPPSWPQSQFQSGGGQRGNMSSQSSQTSSQSIAPIRDPRLDELYNTLLERSKQSLNINRNDPVIRAQADAFSAQQDRASRNYLADLAERSGPIANLQGEQRMMAERTGQNVGAFEAQLMGRELQSRRDEIARALDSRKDLLTTEQQLALQKELASMDDIIRRMSLSQQDRHFGADLDYRNRALSQSGAQFGAEMGYRNRALDLSDMQFRDKLGFDYSDRSNYWDWKNRNGGE